MTKRKRKAAGGVETNPAASQAKRTHYATLLRTVSGNDVATQRARLTAALKVAPITSFDARRFLAIYHPSGRIQELRAQGLKILTRRVNQIDDAGVIHPRIGKFILIGGPHD
ncbi:MAG: helix-turn-helix domain-containing protein [Gallionellaceae bacterium]|nr:helix-turn-helix domain-containing protein [Gallionellaceae bacterium]